MVTFKAVGFRHHLSQDKMIPVKIRITHKRRSSYLDTGLAARLSDFTRTMHLKSPAFLDATNDIIREYRDRINEDPALVNRMTVDQLKNFLQVPRADVSDTGLDFVKFSLQHIEKIKSQKRNGTAEDYETAINAFIRFTGTNSIPVESIKGRLLNAFIAWLPTNSLKKGSRMKRAPSKYLEMLRALYNAMKKEYNREEDGIILIPYSPFKYIEWPKREKVQKRSLPVEVIGKILQLPDEPVKNSKGTNRYQIGKDCFILSFFLMGTNSADLYECYWRNGQLWYERAKVKNRRQDRAEIYIDVPPEISHLMERYKDPEGKRAFNFHHYYKNFDYFNKAINRGLEKVAERIGEPEFDYYAARHTLGTIARNRAGISKDVVHEMLNHVEVDEKLKVTDIYLEKDWTVINKANRKVLNWVLKALKK